MSSEEYTVPITITIDFDTGEESMDAAKKKADASSKSKKDTSKQTDENTDWITRMQQGNLGDLAGWGSGQFGNVKSFGKNPFSFMFRTFFKKLTKGIGVALFAVIILELIKFVIDEAMQAGRWLDRRFRRVAADEILGFYTRQQQADLRQSFSEVRVTTRQGLRGGENQVSGNLFEHQTVSGVLGTKYARYNLKPTNSATVGGRRTDSQGNIKHTSRYG